MDNDVPDRHHSFFFLFLICLKKQLFSLWRAGGISILPVLPFFPEGRNFLLLLRDFPSSSSLLSFSFFPPPQHLQHLPSAVDDGRTSFLSPPPAPPLFLVKNTSYPLPGAKGKVSFPPSHSSQSSHSFPEESSEQNSLFLTLPPRFLKRAKGRRNSTLFSFFFPPSGILLPSPSY